MGGRNPDGRAGLKRGFAEPSRTRQSERDAATLRAVPSPGDSQSNSGTDAAVVLVNYRTPALVERCLASVRASQGKLRLETVVIDNASQDGSVERLRASLPGTEVIAMDENRGFAAGVNAGFRHTTAATVIVLNPDTEVDADTLPLLLAHLREHPRTGVAAPLLEHPDGRLAPNGYRRFPGLFTVGLDLCIPFGYAVAHAPALHPYAMSPSALHSGRRPAWVCGAALAVRRSAYTQAGPLDEGFFLYFEETEWQRRVTTCGWEIALVPDTRVRHLVRGGGEDALAPSPHFVISAMRYLRMRGIPTIISRAALALSLALSWATLSLIAALPAKRARATRQARAYRQLLGRALR